MRDNYMTFSVIVQQSPLGKTSPWLEHSEAIDEELFCVFNNGGFDIVHLSKELYKLMRDSYDDATERLSVR